MLFDLNGGLTRRGAPRGISEEFLLDKGPIFLPLMGNYLTASKAPDRDNHPL